MHSHPLPLSEQKEAAAPVNNIPPFVSYYKDIRVRQSLMKSLREQSTSSTLKEKINDFFGNLVASIAACFGYSYQTTHEKKVAYLEKIKSHLNAYETASPNSSQQQRAELEDTLDEGLQFGDPLRSLLNQAKIQLNKSPIIKLSADVFGHLSEFLGARETKRTIPTLSRNFHALFIESQETIRRKKITHKMFHHVARGEQDEAQAILQSITPEFVKSLLKTRFTITDHAKRQFESITLFQLALWYLDRHMWVMLLQHLEPQEAAIQYEEHDSGKAPYIRMHGKHYNFEGPQGIITALTNFNQLFDHAWQRNPITHDDHFNLQLMNWNAVNHSWRVGIGGALCQVPLHIIHEYCRPDKALLRPPFPLTSIAIEETRFRESTLPRRVDFNAQHIELRPYAERKSYWDAIKNPWLGTLFSLIRGDMLTSATAQETQSAGPPTCQTGTRGELVAMQRLYDVRREQYQALRLQFAAELTNIAAAAPRLSSITQSLNFR